MKKILLGLVLWLYVVSAYAGYASSLEINRIRTHVGVTYVGTTPQPADTCSQWGEYFTFDHRSEDGKSFLTMLLTAKTTGKKVEIWYGESTTPGTDQSNGCTSMATLQGVSIR